jgi:hypothetical protein
LKGYYENPGKKIPERIIETITKNISKWRKVENLSLMSLMRGARSISFQEFIVRASPISFFLNTYNTPLIPRNVNSF